VVNLTCASLFIAARLSASQNAGQAVRRIINPPSSVAGVRALESPRLIIRNSASTNGMRRDLQNGSSVFTAHVQSCASQQRHPRLGAHLQTAFASYQHVTAAAPVFTREVTHLQRRRAWRRASNQRHCQGRRTVKAIFCSPSNQGSAAALEHRPHTPAIRCATPLSLSGAISQRASEAA